MSAALPPDGRETWDEALDRIGRVGTLIRPDPADLDRAERRLGMQLPADYRAFCLAFGFGDFRLSDGQPYYPDEVRIAVPGGAGELFDYDPLGMGRACLGGYYGAGPAVFARNYGSPGGAIVRRMIFFARGPSLAGTHYGWDPAEVTDPAGPEYAIYQIVYSVSRLKRVGDSFTRVVRDELLRGRLDAPGRPDLTFRAPSVDPRYR